MEIIAHKINKIRKLKSLPEKYGSEIDLRSFGSKIILNHDPYKTGDKLEDYLENYNHGTLIFNIKESGLEYETIRLAKKYKIKKFFLLDVEMPLICINKNTINKYMSVRFSEYESINTISKFKNNIGWIWIDTFKNLPFQKKDLNVVRKFNSCLVCPERWGRTWDITKYFKLLKRIKFLPNSVMTDLRYTKKWENLILNF